VWLLPGGGNELLSLDHDLETNVLRIRLDGQFLGAARQAGDEPVVGT